MKIDAVHAINLCRKEIIDAGVQSCPEKIHSILIKYLAGYSNDRLIRNLLSGVKQGSLCSHDLLEMSRLTDLNSILGFFDIPYNLDAYLEAASLTPVPVSSVILSKYPTSKALPVKINACTDGFASPLAVAVFAENYIGAQLSEDHKAYYFVDKFVDRFINITKPKILNTWWSSSFHELIEADIDLIMQACAVWVHLHEYHHRVGFLPLPQHLDIKSTRNGGGAEELRADIFSLIALTKLDSLEPIVEITKQFILAERLIGYTARAKPLENYDARSAVALFNYFLRHGVVLIKDNRFMFSSSKIKLIDALYSIAVKVTAIEYKLSSTPSAEKKNIWAKVLPDLAKNNNAW